MYVLYPITDVLYTHTEHLANEYARRISCLDETQYMLNLFILKPKDEYYVCTNYTVTNENEQNHVSIYNKHFS